LSTESLPQITAREHDRENHAYARESENALNREKLTHDLHILVMLCNGHGEMILTNVNSI